MTPSLYVPVQPFNPLQISAIAVTSEQPKVFVVLSRFGCVNLVLDPDLKKPITISVKNKKQKKQQE